LVKWAGVYGMVEYSSEKLSASVQGSVSEQYYKRRDYMLYTPEIRKPNGITKRVIL
jgi:hypothetical protein